MAQNIANSGFVDKSHRDVCFAPKTKVRDGVSRVLLAALD